VTFEVRPLSEQEFPAFARAFMTSFGETVGNEAVESLRRGFTLDRGLAAFDGSRLVGTAASFASELTLPGTTTAQVGAVTLVGVLPTHRRRGLLRRMMDHQLSELRDRGESLAVLTASEGGIYRRFGYGPATTSAWHTIRRRGCRLRQVPEPAEFRMIPPADADDVLGPVYDRARRAQPGDLRRPAEWWDLHLRPAEAADNKARFVAVRTGPGGDDAYSVYRVKTDWDRGIARNRLIVESLVALTPDSRAGMVDYLFGLDLVETVTFENRPVEDDLRWLLADVRQLETRYTRDWLWVRPIDVRAALRARRYRIADHLGIAVADPQCPWNSGRWWVDGGPDGASCAAAGPGQAIGLAMGPAELGSVLLGGVTCSALVRAGLIEELEPGAAARADVFLGTDEAPYCSTAF
jgi:predicted acetyltransferase